MIILIAGASHTGKTALAQRILEKYQIPYFSLDHLKMGLIRSGETCLTPSDDEKLTPYLWNITKEMIKTAIENKQDLIIEGCYIPFTWQEDFETRYLKDITYRCLVMTEAYIKRNFSIIKEYSNIIEQRLDDSYNTVESMVIENINNLKQCQQDNLPYILIDDTYNIDLNTFNLD